jgi:hypothetical protein
MGIFRFRSKEDGIMKTIIVMVLPLLLFIFNMVFSILSMRTAFIVLVFSAMLFPLLLLHNKDFIAGSQGVEEWKKVKVFSIGSLFTVFFITLTMIVIVVL